MTTPQLAVAGAAEHCDALRALGAFPEDSAAILLVGSRARGWANPTSDYDFCVVTASLYTHSAARMTGVPLDPSTMSTREFELGDQRAEVAYWSLAQFNQMIAKVSWAVFDSGEASLKTLTDLEQTVLERLTTAVPLHGADELDRLRTALGSSAHRAFITVLSVSSADGKLEDIAGMLDVGDLPSAVLAARLALDHMVDALLDSRGVYGTNIPKWRWRRLSDLREPQFPAGRYWDLVTMHGYGRDNAEQWVQVVVAQCQDLQLLVEI